MVLCAQTLSCWKMNMLEISHMADKNCCNSNTPYWSWHRDRQVSNWCNVNHLWLADRCHQWLNVTCVAGALSRRLSCWLTHVHIYSRSFCGFLGVATVNVFLCSSVNKNDANIVWQIFWATILNGWVLHGGSPHSAVGHDDFWAQTLWQGSVATPLRSDGIFNYRFARNLLLSLPVKECCK